MPTLRSKWIYVSGPIAAVDDDGNHPSEELVKTRKERFHEAEKFIRYYDPAAWVVNPVNIPACTPVTNYCQPENGKHDWLCYMRHDLRELVMCDEIVMLPGWERSPGAMAEIKVANMLMILPSFYNHRVPAIQSWPIGNQALKTLENL